MRQPFEKHTGAKYKGFTLIELLIAITVGLIVISAASSVLQRTVRENLKISDSAMLQEAAFFTSFTVEQYLRQTGFRSIDSTLINGRRLPIRRNEEVFPSVDSAWSQGQYLKTDDSSISFRFSGSSDSDGVADGSMVDCAGNAIGADTISDIGLSLANGRLVCTSGGTQQTLLGSDNTLSVETLAISLGVDEGNNGSIDRYVDSGAASANDMASTQEVILRMLLVSNRHVDAFGRTYTFNGVDIAYPDNRYRRELVIRTMLRNAAGAT